MAMHRVPTLVVGVGGIGCRIAANISDLLTDEARERVGIIGMDTNINDLNRIAQRGVRTIQTSDTRTVGEYLQHNPQHLPWFPLTRFTASKSLLNGAGQIRAVSRLGALAAEERGAFLPIKQEIHRIRANRGDSANGDLTVMVVGSITGGTGAGLFLQLPYYIRNLVQGESGLRNIIIRGMFLGPDFTVDVQPSQINKDAVRVNAYSCLKELNALYLSQNKPEKIQKLKLDFFSPMSEKERRMISSNIQQGWEKQLDFDPGYTSEALENDTNTILDSDPLLPYNYIYLLENDAPEGSFHEEQIANVESLAARMVHTLMFTPVSESALSVEDNMILHDALNNGMNRYSSAGLLRLVYPVEQVQKYVALRTVHDLVQSEWLLLDTKYKANAATERSMKKSDSTQTITTLRDFYVSQFEEDTEVRAPLSNLSEEAFYEDKNLRKRVSKATLFMRVIDSKVKEITGSKEVKDYKEKCELAMGQMKKFGDASEELENLENELQSFRLFAEDTVSKKPYTIANELFPPTMLSLRHRKKSATELNDIYQLLHNVHPITARFLCYDLMKRLEKKINESENKFIKADLNAYFDFDFDGATPDEKDSALSALENLKGTRNKKALSKLLFTEEHTLEGLAVMVQGQAQNQVMVTSTYLEHGLIVTICKILLERIQQLADNYAAFFSSIENMIAENEHQISLLENIQMPAKQIGVFCSTEALKTVAAEYQVSADRTLPAETKEAIFYSMFKVMTDDIDQASKIQTERQKAAYAAKRIKVLRKTFQTSIVDTIQTAVVKKGANAIDMNIYQALEREFELEHPEREDFTEYLQERIAISMKEAAPLVATTEQSRSETTATAYIAMHPDCAATEMGVPHVGATQKLYAPKATEYTGFVKPTAILDEAFSPYEITCFRARYKFSIEDLVKYTPGKANANAYNARVSMIGKAPIITGNPDDGLTVINPHLDRYWHEEAYLPNIYASEEAHNRQNVFKAFIYSLGFKMFSIVEDDSTIDENGNCLKFWYYNKSVPVTVRNSRIGLGYVDLLNAIPHNGRLKDHILKVSISLAERRKGFSTPAELQQDYATDSLFTGLKTAKAYGKDTGNILDVFMDMRGRMEVAEWNNLPNHLLDVLLEYYSILYQEDQRLVTLTVRAILKDLLENCSLAKKDADKLTLAETFLKDTVMELSKKQY